MNEKDPPGLNISVYISKELIAKIRTLAKDEDRRTNWWITKRLEEAVAAKAERLAEIEFGKARENSAHNAAQQLKRNNPLSRAGYRSDSAIAGAKREKAAAEAKAKATRKSA